MSDLGYIFMNVAIVGGMTYCIYREISNIISPKIDKPVKKDTLDITIRPKVLSSIVVGSMPLNNTLEKIFKDGVNVNGRKYNLVHAEIKLRLKENDINTPPIIYDTYEIING